MTCRTGLLRGQVDGVLCGLQRFVSGLRQIKNGTKRCSPHRKFMKTMCTYMDRQSDRLQKRKLLPEYLDVLGVPMGKTIMDDILRD